MRYPYLYPDWESLWKGQSSEDASAENRSLIRFQVICLSVVRNLCYRSFNMPGGGAFQVLLLVYTESLISTR